MGYQLHFTRIEESVLLRAHGSHQVAQAFLPAPARQECLATAQLLMQAGEKGRITLLSKWYSEAEFNQMVKDNQR
jgi:hypothetical protein